MPRMKHQRIAPLFVLALLVAGCASDPCELDPDRQPPFSPIAERHYLLAKELFESGYLVDANYECETALEYQPGHTRALALLYKVRFMINRDKTPPPHANPNLYKPPQ